MEAKNGLFRRPGWGDVYDYDYMHADYQNLPYDDEDPSLNESFMADCKVFSDFVYPPNDDTNDDY